MMKSSENPLPSQLLSRNKGSPVSTSLVTVQAVFLFILIFLFSNSQVHAVDPASEISGKVVRNIMINIRDIFEKEKERWLYRTINRLKISTHEKVVRQELLFKEGDVIDQFILSESLRNLRSLRFLRQASIDTLVVGEHVDIVVNIQETWTLLPYLALSYGTGKNHWTGGIRETDFLGYGKRVELLYEQDDRGDSVEAVYDDRRFLDTDYRLLTALFLRSDGEKLQAAFDKPFRSLLDPDAFLSSATWGDTLGRLFKDGDENFVYRQNTTDLVFGYGQAKGKADVSVRRYSLGWRYTEDNFDSADAEDIADLDLDPDLLDQDPSRLAEDRRFSGPTLLFSSIEPDFLSLPYIDFFGRVQDFNLGPQFALNSQVASRYTGSEEDALLFSLNQRAGMRFSESSFFRHEVGLGARVEEWDVSNLLARAEVKYYNHLGHLAFGGIPIGKHTLAVSAFIDYGYDLDGDRQLSIGSDNALRAYKARLFTGDKRLAFNVEDRVVIIENVLQLVDIGAATFIDVAGASYDPLEDLLASDIFYNIGVGLRFSSPRSSGHRVLRIDLALALREVPGSTRVWEPRISVSSGQLFSAYMRSERLGSERATSSIGLDR